MDWAHSFPSPKIRRGGAWTKCLLILMAICCSYSVPLFATQGHAAPCIDLADQMVPGGDESTILVSPPGFQVRIMAYEMPSGFLITGVPSVVDQRQTGSWGRGLFLDHLRLAIDFGSRDSVYIRFRYKEGYCYLNINGQAKHFKSPLEINGTVLGGVRVYVYPGDNESEGYFVLSGKMDRFVDFHENPASLIIGGQALIISSICTGR